MAGLEWARVVRMSALHALPLAAVVLGVWFVVGAVIALLVGRWFRFVRGDFDGD